MRTVTSLGAQRGVAGSHQQTILTETMLKTAPLEDILARRKGICELGLSGAANPEDLAAQIVKISSTAALFPSSDESEAKCSSPVSKPPPWGDPLSAKKQAREMAKGKENVRTFQQNRATFQPQIVQPVPTPPRLAGVAGGEAAAKMAARRKAVDSVCFDDCDEIAEVGPGVRRKNVRPRDEDALKRVLEARREHILSFEERAKNGETFGAADVDSALASAARTLREVEKKAYREKYDQVLSDVDLKIASFKTPTPKKMTAWEGGGGIKDRIARLGAV